MKCIFYFIVDVELKTVPVENSISRFISLCMVRTIKVEKLWRGETFDTETQCNTISSNIHKGDSRQS